MRMDGAPDSQGLEEGNPKCLLQKTAPGIPSRFLKTVRSDDGAEGNGEALTCNLDCICDRLTCGQCVRECRSLPWSRVIESDGLDLTAEECVLLFQVIECGV